MEGGEVSEHNRRLSCKCDGRPPLPLPNLEGEMNRDWLRTVFWWGIIIVVLGAAFWFGVLPLVDAVMQEAS